MSDGDKSGTINFEHLRLQVRSYYDIQKLRIQYELRLKDLQRRGVVSTEGKAEEHYGVSFQCVRKAEVALNREVRDMIRGHPVADWAMSVRGIGPTLAGAFLAEIGSDRQARLDLSAVPSLRRVAVRPTDWVTHPDRLPLPRDRREGDDDESPDGSDADKSPTDMQLIKRCWLREDHGGIVVLEERRGIECFPAVSTLWKFSGLAVVPDPKHPGQWMAPRAQRGVKSNWNPFLRALAFKMSTSWVKCGGFFRGIYDTEKARQLAHGDVTKLRAHRRACRKAAKLFFALAWEVWRRSEGLDVRRPYAEEKLGHESMLAPEDVVEIKDDETESEAA